MHINIPYCIIHTYALVEDVMFSNNGPKINIDLDQLIPFSFLCTCSGTEPLGINGAGFFCGLDGYL